MAREVQCKSCWSWVREHHVTAHTVLCQGRAHYRDNGGQFFYYWDVDDGVMRLEHYVFETQTKLRVSHQWEEQFDHQHRRVWFIYGVGQIVNTSIYGGASHAPVSAVEVVRTHDSEGVGHAWLRNELLLHNLLVDHELVDDIPHGVFSLLGGGHP